MVFDKVKIWLKAIRPFSLTGSLIPILSGGIVASKEGLINGGYLVLSLIAMVFLQIGANLISDRDDFINKVDTKDSLGSSGMIIQGFLKPKQVLNTGISILLLGCVIGLFLAYERGYIVLVLGLIGALGSYFYTSKPFSLKYRGLGMPLVFLLFGPLPVLGAYYVQTQTFSLAALIISIPIGLLTTAILHANDIRDIVNDSKAGIKTFSIVIGQYNAKMIYLGLYVISYVSILMMIAFGTLSLWSIIIMITLPIAIKNLNKIFCSDNIDTIDKDTAMLQMLFGVLLIITMLI